MKNWVFRGLVVSITLNFGLSLAMPSSAHPKSPSRNQTGSLSVMLPLPAPTDDYEELLAIAAQAFQTLSPATKLWFAATAKEYASQHPAGGAFDSVWAAKTLQKKFSVSGSGQIGDLLIAVMFILAQDAVKEAREDRKLQRLDGKQGLHAKEAKLNAQNQTIGQLRDEASERYEHAMRSADQEMVMGIVSMLGPILNTGIGSLVDGKHSTAKVDEKNLQQAVIRKLRAQLVTLRATGL
jgi:hypothetical protein